MPDDDKGGGEVRFMASAQLYGYLGWLAKNTALGRSENEVAKQILTETLSKMRGESYRDRA
jgi:hypothetical protein